MIEATNASEAIEVLKSGIRIAAVFSDIQMPGPVNGLGLARWVAANCVGIPMILASGNSSFAEVAEVGAVSCFFQKPYQYNAVHAYISALLERH